ncbi:MAG: hypothetical protein SH819_14940 [Cytophagales bacterium]|nr:hypothetical protein [Cytophagales bacterium]
MKMPLETFKGIEFVRISSMPKEQQERIWQTFESEKIIKIVKDQALMNDCILYADYAAWHSGFTAARKQQADQPSMQGQVGKLAFE